jgi:hypothetical protein
MARISEDALTSWQNGNIVTAEKLKRDRSVFITAINDNYDKILDLQNTVQIAQVEDYTWVATEGQTIFNLPSGKSYEMGENVLRVVVEGFELANTGDVQEFEEVSSTSFKINDNLSAGTVVFASWTQVRLVKALSEDVAVFNIMGVF